MTKTRPKKKPALAIAPSTPPAEAMVKLTATSASPAQKMNAWNRWRERYNPLRQLTITRAITLLEQYQRGEMADPQWVFYFLEMTDPDLVALVTRRTSALLELDWNAKTIPKNRQDKDFSQDSADEQARAINELIEGIDNFEEALEHLELAFFRGFAHLEKWENPDGDIYHLEIVDQWNMVRNLLRGPWRYNPQAFATTYEQISPDNDVDPSRFLIFEIDRPLDRLGLIKFVRSNLGEKDWDAFVEIYGIPSGVIIMPPDVPKEKETEYQKSAQQIAEGGSGSIPHGSDYKPNSPLRGVNPFKERLDFLTEKLILAGTCGQLTMLASPTGIGHGATPAHEEAFRKIARMDASKISGIIQRQLVDPFLEAKFPGQGKLAYFEIAPSEDIDPGDIAEHINKFAQAGFRGDETELTEKTGYKLIYAPLERVTVREMGTLDPAQEAGLNPGMKGAKATGQTPPPPATGASGPRKFVRTVQQNRGPGISGDPDLETYLGPLRDDFLKAFANDLRPIRNSIEWALAGTDETAQKQRLQILRAQLPDILRLVNRSDKSAKALAEIMKEAFTKGIEEAKTS